MRWILGLTLALASCSDGPATTEQKSLRALLDSDLTKGDTTLTCTESTSGACHVLFVTGDKTGRISASVGASAAAHGLGDGTRYCIGAEAPQDGCSLRPLRDGQEIYRGRATRTR